MLAGYPLFALYLLATAPSPAEPYPQQWSAPCQAVWPGDAVPVKVEVAAAQASMSGVTSLSVDILATSSGVAVSPFLQTTRGITLQVETMAGKPVASAEPMMGSPPPPPLEPDQLTKVSPFTPFQVKVRERTRTIFPGPGRYRLRAVITLFDPSTTPARYGRIVSAPVSIKITD